MRPTHPDECSCAGRRVDRLQVAGPVHKAHPHPSHSPFAVNTKRITAKAEAVKSGRQILTLP